MFNGLVLVFKLISYLICVVIRKSEFVEYIY